MLYTIIIRNFSCLLYFSLNQWWHYFHYKILLVSVITEILWGEAKLFNFTSRCVRAWILLKPYCSISGKSANLKISGLIETGLNYLQTSRAPRICRYFTVVRVGRQPFSSLEGRSTDILIERKDKKGWGEENDCGKPKDDQRIHSTFLSKASRSHWK